MKQLSLSEAVALDVADATKLAQQGLELVETGIKVTLELMTGVPAFCFGASILYGYDLALSCCPVSSK